MRPSDTLLGLVAALALVAGSAAAQPSRVVSMNLCTDQLALMLAAPGQLVSVSALSQDPGLSAMAKEARHLPANSGRAEEVYELQPDLVLAGAYTSPAAVGMLRRLGIAVETFAPVRSFEDVRDHIMRVGVLIGRETAAANVVAAFDARLTALRDEPASGLGAALWQAQGYSAGTGTLSDDILSAAGLANLAAEAGLQGGGFLPLEVLVQLTPDILVHGTAGPGASRAEEVLTHPALDVAPVTATVEDRHWMCGTPAVLEAVEALAAIRESARG